MYQIKVIKTEEDYNEALEQVEKLVESDPDPESAEGEKLSLLSTLVEDYESRRFPAHLPTPIAAIQFRMEQEDLKPADLIPYIGSRSRVSEVLSGKRQLTLDMVRALEAGLGIPAEVLIKKPDPGEEKYENWSTTLVREMSERGYFKRVTFDGKNKGFLLSSFFKGSQQGGLQLAWRRTIHSRTSLRTDTNALAAWAEFVTQKASGIKTPVAYKDGTVTLEFLKTIAQLSNEKDGPLLAQAFLKKHGIVMVVVRHLSKTKVDGVAILEDKTRPIIGLSLRFDRLDNFWFTLLHELSHVALHLNQDNGLVFFDELEDGRDIEVDEKEKEADALTEEAIVPKSKWSISPARATPSSMAAQSLATELGVHIAVIAGFVRHKHQNYFYLTKIVNNGDAKVRHYFPKEFSQ